MTTESQVKRTAGMRNAVYLPSSSASFFFCRSSIIATCWSVIFCTSSSAAPLVVFGDLVVLEQLLQPVVGVAAHLADAVAPLFGVLVHQLRQLLAPLLGQRGNRNADHLAVGGRIQAEVGAADGAFDRGDQRRIERLRDDHRRFGNRQRRHLIERHHRAVGLDVHGVEDRHRRAAGAHARPARAARARSAPSMRFLTSAISPFRSDASIPSPAVVAGESTATSARLR